MFTNETIYMMCSQKSSESLFYITIINIKRGFSNVINSFELTALPLITDFS